MIELETDRLIMREWQEADIQPYAAMNRDDRVMDYFPFHLTLEESREMVNIFCQRNQNKEFNYLALIEKKSDSFVGMLNLSQVSFEAEFTPAMEIGWRLAFDHWGRGYAVEAAQAMLNYGFEKLNLAEIVSFTAIGNKRSIAVMQRIGMKNGGEFDHPGLPQQDPLCRHVLYRLAQVRK